MESEDSRTRRKFQPCFRAYARGLGFGLWLLITSTLGVLFFHFVPYLFVILFLNPHLYRWLADEMIGSWLVYCVALLELLMGMKVVITGDKIRSGERSIILMNHRTRLDWMYFWSVLVRQASVKTEKIILKSPLKYIPGAGWAMQVGAFIFINRNWEEDKKTLTKMVNYFSDLNHKTQILLFPEGTDLTPRTKSRSDEFAKKNGWTPYEYCLHPRTTGFTFLADLMRKNDHLDSVYDVTIAYPYNFPQTEPQLISGNVPKEVHFHIQRYPIQSLPDTEEDLQTWCQQQWQQKEDRLKQFHVEKKFPNDSKMDSDGDGNLNRSGHHETSTGHNESRFDNTKVKLYIVFVYWTLFVIGISLILWYSSLARWLALAQIIFYLYMGHKWGGFELFQADYFNWFFNRKKRD